MAFIRPLVSSNHYAIRSCSSLLPSFSLLPPSSQLGAHTLSFRREKSSKMTDWYHKIYHQLKPNPLPPSPPPPPTPHNSIDLHSPFPHCDDNRESHNLEDLLHDLPPSPPPSSPPPPNFGLVLLNCPFGNLFSDGALWSSAGVKVCADGAANRLYDNFRDCVEEREKFLPDVIIGDMDSLRSEVAEFYKSRGVPCLKIYDDTTTDLEKSILYLSALRLGLDPPILPSSSLTKNIENIVVYGVFWGRFDHQLSAINTLHKYAFLPPPPSSPPPPPSPPLPPFPAPPPIPTTPSPFLFPQINLISEGNYGRLLPPGRHFIRVSHYFQPLGTVCGILPVGGVGGEGGPRVRTRGLEWDLGGEVVGMGWGGVVSSSNQVVGEEVVVEVEGGSVFWWTGLKGGEE